MTTNAKRIINDAIEAWRAPEDASFGRVAVDALMAGHDDVHLHRHDDGTVTVTPMCDAYDTLPSVRVGTPLWVDVEGDAS